MSQRDIRIRWTGQVIEVIEMLTLYCVPETRGLRVIWMLEELGQPYQLEQRSLEQVQQLSCDFLLFNQMGKVPVLKDGELFITQSPAINTYLGDKFAARQLVPEPGTKKRISYEQWCYFITSDLEVGVWAIEKHTKYLPPEQRLPRAADLGWWEFVRTANIVSDGFGNGPFLLGEEFSAVDILLAHTLMWGKRLSIPLGSQLDSYLENCMSRPAFVRAKAKEDSMDVDTPA